MPRFAILAGGLLLALTGCTVFGPLFDDDKSTELAFNDAGPTPPPTVRQASYAPASQETAWRVDKVGRSLVGDNPQYGLRPFFATIGSPQPEIFHAGANVVYVTEGLVRQCKADEELAAVLASELGKMVSEREARAGKALRDPDRLPPVQLPIGGHGAGSEAADPTNFIEQARFERDHPRNRRLTRPDPQVVARGLLERGGYRTTELDGVEPILQAAAKNCTFEQQFKGVPKQSDWQR